jgi:putative tricarboxylic transport membrane protein
MWVSDAVFGVVLLLLATAIIVLAQAFPAMPGQDYGPALFPTLIAAGFGLCGLVLLVRTLPRVRTEGLFHVRGWEGGWGGRLGDVLLIVGGLVAWILVWNPVGFLLGATAYAGALMTRFRGRPVSSLWGWRWLWSSTGASAGSCSCRCRWVRSPASSGRASPWTP